MPVSKAASDMFSIEQINDLHSGLGSAKTLPEYVLALKVLGVERYDSYLVDGHSEYFGQGGLSAFFSCARGASRREYRSTRDFPSAPASARAARDDLPRDVQGLGAEWDREVDCGYR